MTLHGPLPLPEPGPGAPAVPLPLARDVGTRATEHRGTSGGPVWPILPDGTTRVVVPDELVERLAALAPVTTFGADPAGVAEAGRDWWPAALLGAAQGRVAGLAEVVVRPEHPDAVAAVLALCHQARVPVTTAAGRSGVLGGAVPCHGGVLLDLCGLAGIRSVDAVSMVVDVGPGTFGDRFETELRTRHGLTCGHWPQSMNLSTVGGWVACRGAGQLSTRYGKIEDLVVGLDVALADGRVISTGGAPRAATGPDLTSIFVGSEGTLGVITGVRLRCHPAPTATVSGAWLAPGFGAALEGARAAVQAGATPAVLRCYDAAETARTYGREGAMVIVIDEGDPGLITAGAEVVRRCLEAAGAEPVASGEDPVAHWLAHRNEVSALGALIGRGYIVDTMEVAAPWSAVGTVAEAMVDALQSVSGTLAASAHCSHSYTDGACVYVTFAGQREADRTVYSAEAWQAGTAAALSAGAALSHHHGIGRQRGGFLADALGPAFEVLVGLKNQLDPHGILNPGKLGLPDPWADGQQ